MKKWTFKYNNNNDILIIKKEIKNNKDYLVYSLFESKDLNDLKRIRYNNRIYFYKDDKYFDNLEELYDYIINILLLGYFYQKYKFDEKGNRRDHDDCYEAIFYSLEYKDLNDFEKNFFEFCLKHQKFKEKLKITLKKIPNLYNHYFKENEKKEICYSMEGVITKILELKKQIINYTFKVNEQNYIIQEILETKVIFELQEKNFPFIYDIDIFISKLKEIFNIDELKENSFKNLEEIKRKEEDILNKLKEITDIEEITNIEKEYKILNKEKEEILKNIKNINIKYNSIFNLISIIKEYKSFIDFLSNSKNNNNIFIKKNNE